MTRVFVLGHRGMLGHMVAAYLREQGCEVITSSLRYGGGPQDGLVEAVRQSPCTWVVNALGAIPQKGRGPEEMYRANTHFPLHLLQALRTDQRLIHASSDCVFSGKKGQYRASDTRDADSVYGHSKALGESVALDPRTVCFRVSIVGPEQEAGNGLLGWFLKQQSGVTGYTNHFWNGITTLEWAGAAAEVIRGESPFTQGLVQLGVTEMPSKFELLNLFAETWGRSIEIRPGETRDRMDRTLTPGWVRPPLKQQLLTLRSWMDKMAVTSSKE